MFGHARRLLGPDQMDISESNNCFPQAHPDTTRRPHDVVSSRQNEKRRIFAYIRFGLGRRLGSRRSNPTRGKHRLPPVSTVQTCIGLSSAESELHALTRGGCSAMGTQSHLADRHVPTAIILFSDASAKRCNAEEISRKAEMCSNETLLVVGTEIRRWRAQTSQRAHGRACSKTVATVI